MFYRILCSRETCVTNINCPGSKVYTKNVCFCSMKTLSLKLDDDIFNEAEEITNKLNLARNRYINEAVSIYNRVNKRRLLKKQLVRESALTTHDTLEILREFEMLLDEN